MTLIKTECHCPRCGKLKLTPSGKPHKCTALTLQDSFAASPIEGAAEWEMEARRLHADMAAAMKRMADNVTLLNAMRQDCFLLGENAHAHGMDITDNPFGDHGEASKQWGAGWLVSEQLAYDRAESDLSNVAVSHAPEISRKPQP